MRKAIVLIGCWATLLLARADDMLDFSVVVPPALDRHVLVRPNVSWEVRTDATTHCQGVDHDGYAIWGEGCVHWNKTKSTCTIVTKPQTTHSLMGHLFLLCLSAGEPS